MSEDGEARLHFDRIAPMYARPDYPPELFEQLAAWGIVLDGRQVLELGPGSGQATKALLARGVAHIDAVELGSRLAQELRACLPDARLHLCVGDAHAVPLPEQAYDLGVAATSFHWLDAARMMPRLAAAIRPRGWLCVWWTEYGDADVITPFRTGLKRIEQRYGLHKPGPPASLSADDRLSELMQGGLFHHPHHQVFRWSLRMTSAQVHGLFSTFSNFGPHPDALTQIAQLVDDLGGTVTEHYVTVLYAVRRA